MLSKLCFSNMCSNGNATKPLLGKTGFALQTNKRPWPSISIMFVTDYFQLLLILQFADYFKTFLVDKTPNFHKNRLYLLFVSH